MYKPIQSLRELMGPDQSDLKDSDGLIWVALWGKSGLGDSAEGRRMLIDDIKSYNSKKSDNMFRYRPSIAGSSFDEVGRMRDKGLAIGRGVVTINCEEDRIEKLYDHQRFQEVYDFTEG